LHYLLLARPDLHVAQRLLTSDTEIKFLFGIGGVGIRTYTVPLGTASLYELMHAFIYRLYSPGYFADPSYIRMEPDLENHRVSYTVQITGVNDEKIICPNFFPVYGSSSPFGDSNPNSFKPGF
jgi:hypothetical protein